MTRRDDDDFSQKLKVRVRSAETNTTAIVEMHLEGVFFPKIRVGFFCSHILSIWFNLS